MGRDPGTCMLIQKARLRVKNWCFSGCHERNGNISSVYPLYYVWANTFYFSLHSGTYQ